MSFPTDSAGLFIPKKMTTDSIFNCSEGELYLNHIGIKMVLLYQIIPSIFAIFANGFFLKSGLPKIYFHPNLKAIIKCSVIFNIIHSIAVAFLQSSHLFLFTFMSSPCAVYVPVWYCISLRGIITFSMVIYVPLHLGMIVERTLATAKLSHYEDRLAGLGCYFLLIVILFALGVTVFGLWNTPLIGTAAYCAAVNEYTEQNISLSCYVLTGIELCTIFYFLALWVKNKRLQKMKQFAFKASYQIKENLNAMSLLLPWIFFHFIVFTLFYSANTLMPYIGNWGADIMTIRTGYALVYFVPFYCLLTPLLLEYIVWKQRKERQTQLKRIVRTPIGNDYVEYLNKVW